MKLNISERLKARLEEAISSVGDLSDEDIQQYQTEIVQLARKLEEEGKIASLEAIMSEKATLSSKQNRSSKESVNVSENESFEM